MQDDIEDGEVVDSENEEQERKAALPVTFTANPATSFTWRAETTFTGFGSTAAATASSVSTAQKPVQRLRNDSDSSSSDSASDDDDDDGAPSAKKKCPANHCDLASSHTPTAAARPSTKYSIWGSVLQEQTLAKDLGGWFGMNTKIISDRDVETYDYRKAKKIQKAATDSVDVDIADDCEVEELPENDNDDVNICDRETFGTSASATTGGSGQSHSGDGDNITSRKRRHNGTTLGSGQRLDVDKNRPNARDRLSKRTYDAEKDRSYVLVSVNDPAINVAQELIRLLGEPDHMKDTFVRIVETLGAEKALELLYCTEDLEEAGGLMTLNGSRRRTAGGVYLFLLKDDPSISRGQQDIIFYGSAEERKKQQRASKQRRWQHHHDNITKSHLVDDILRPLPDRRDLFLQNRLANGKAEPTPAVVETCEADDPAATATDADNIDDEEDADVLQIELS